MRGVSSSVEGSSRYFVLSIARALKILEAFSDNRHWLSLTDLAAQSGQNKATARRIALTLCDLGYLQQDQARRFSLTPRVLDLGSYFLRSTSLPEVAEPLLADLAGRLHESVNLAIRDGRDVLYLVRIAAAQRILAVNLHVGSRLPLHATSLGKALLMGADREELVSILGAPPWPKFTKVTRTDPDQLMNDLGEARLLGCTVGNGELEPGLRAIAAPVRNGDGAIVAAVNVSTNVMRVPLDQLLGPIRQELLKTAAAISSSLAPRR